MVKDIYKVGNIIKRTFDRKDHNFLKDDYFENGIIEFIQIIKPLLYQNHNKFITFEGINLKTRRVYSYITDDESGKGETGLIWKDEITSTKELMLWKI